AGFGAKRHADRAAASDPKAVEAPARQPSERCQVAAIVASLEKSGASAAQAFPEAVHNAALWAAADRRGGRAHPYRARLLTGPVAAEQPLFRRADERWPARRAALLHARQNRANQSGMPDHD